MTREFILTRAVGWEGCPRGDKNDREWRLRNKKPTSVSQCLTGSWRSKAEAKGAGSLAIISTALLAEDTGSSEMEEGSAQVWV